MRQPISSKQREREAYRGLAQTAQTAAATEPDGSAAQSHLAGDAPNLRPSKAQRRRYLRHYAAWLRPFVWHIALVMLMALGVAALDVTWPLAIMLLLNILTGSGISTGAGGAGAGAAGRGSTISRVLGGATAHGASLGRLLAPLHNLHILVASILVLLVVKQSLDSLRSYRVAVLNNKLILRLRRMLFDRLVRLGLGQLAGMKSGGVVARLSGDVDSVGGLIQMAIISPGVAAVRVVLTVTILLFMSWKLALATMLLTPPLAVASYLWLRKVRPIYRSIRSDAGRIDGRVTETFGGIRVVRAFRRESREEKNYALGHHTVIRKLLRATRLELVLEAVWGLLIPITTLLLVWYGGTLVRAGQMTVGGIFAFQIYAVLLLQPVWLIVQSVSQTQKSLAAMERLFAILDEPADMPDATGAICAPEVVRQIEFRGVGFAYRPGIPVIRDFSLNVVGGQTVALVGPSGAGKTTLTDLVARFYDPTSGAILLNGVDLRRIALGSYRQLLAIVQQDTFLFDGSVRENIAYGRRGATDEQIIEAARRANAHEFVSRLPEGYQTHVGERGVKLSGGQRQRLSIARAILADPQILILDEATSALDTQSEQLIQAALQELLKKRTTFIIAHRLSTISHADLIVVIIDGRPVEIGTHDELLGQRGIYFGMVNRQRRNMEGGDGSMASPAREAAQAVAPMVEAPTLGAPLGWPDRRGD